MTPRRQKPIPPQQGGLFCRTCSAPLISPDEQRQQQGLAHQERIC